jgi:hypothetical protein
MQQTRRAILHSVATPTLVVIVVCLLYVAAVLIRVEADPLAFAVLGTRFSQGDPQGSEGYDGQFAYQIALRPLDAAPYLDVPAYRYQRILYPMLARLLALGQPEAIPWTLILANVAAIGLGTWATERLLLHFGVSRWYALSYGLYGGQLLALRTDLNEPWAQALVQCAMLAWAKDRRPVAICAFGLAALTKETTLIFLAAYMLYSLKKRMWRSSIGLCAAALPFVMYQALLWASLGNPGIGSGGANATPFSLVPLGGWLAITQVNLVPFLLISLIVVPMSVLPAIAGIVSSLRDLLQGKDHPITYSLLLNALVILFLPASTFREPAAMVRLTQGLAASMVVYGGLRRSTRVLTYSMLWIATNVLLIKGVAM